MKKLFVILICAALAGCAMLSATVSKGQEDVMDIVVASAERTICRDIPIGTWKRLYGSNPVRAKAWRDLCSNPVELPQ